MGNLKQENLSEFNSLLNYSNYLDAKINFVDDLYMAEKSESDGTYIVGSEQSEQFFKVPKIGYDVMMLIWKGNKIKDIIPIIGSEIDYIDFIKTLDSMGIIKDINTSIRSNEKRKRVGLKFKNKFFFKPYTSLFFNSTTKFLFLFSIFLIFCVSFFENKYYDSSILPSVDVIFSFPNLLYGILIVLILDIILGLTHEMGHLLSARHFGLRNVNMNIGRRLVSLVYQTQLPGIWKLDSKSKHIIYLSGMLMDIYLLAFLKLLSLFTISNNLIFMHNVMNVAILLIFIGILFEFRIYMRTDLYYFLSDFLNEPNLHQKSTELAKQTFKFIVSKEKVKPQEERKIINYTFFMVICSFVDVFLLIQYIIPAISNFIVFTKTNISIHHFDLNYIANVIAVLLLITELLFTLYLFIQEKKVKREEV
ncbi:hypothetical protein [Bacillus cereus group sp. Bce018]|uniref:hypothetical protein n=1 Tax=Bacillus cereus group sp. Bce018 TaxID=3445248 RepID=UPI0033081AB9|nr:hypothetical protein [Bacillus anthracis]